MSYTNTGRHTGGTGTGNRPANRPARRNASYGPDGIDRYNYVDRDIYSNSRDRRAVGSGAKRKKKKSCAGRILKTFLILLLIVALGGAAYAAVMFSRLNRTPDADSEDLAGYVQQPSEAPAWDVKSDDKVLNILLIGADENEDGSDGRSDTNMLMSIDQPSKTIRLVSFLRDSYLEIPTVGKNKLNAAYAHGGAALTMQTLENNYRVNIDKYVSVDFDSFAEVIDKMGGLDVPMSASTCREENANMGTHLKAGVNHLSGKLCLYYARIRAASDEFGSNDYGRTGRQRQVVELMLQKMKSLNLVNASKIMYDYLPCVKTNLSDSELLYLASIGATVSNYQVEKQQMPAPNTFDDQKSIKGIGKVITLDLEKNCSILRKFLYGESGGGDSGTN